MSLELINSLTKMEIMELWACNTDVFDSVERQVYDNKKE